MKYRTKRAIQWYRSYSVIPGPIDIPSGAPVVKAPAADGTPGLFWIDDKFFKDDCILRHDAATHGCRVYPENVEEVVS